MFDVFSRRGIAGVRFSLPAMAAGWVIAALAAPAAAQSPHVHGQARLDIAIDGPVLAVTLTAPLDGIVGFEHRPRTAAQRQAAQAALARLQAGHAMFTPPAAAQCGAESATVAAPVLQAADAKDAAGHADLDATWTFRCSAPQHLATLEQGLFDAFPRLRRLEVQVAGPGGQVRASLRAPARAVTLRR